MTFVLGLTGSIGMGKSTTAALFVKRGVPLHDADAAVHRLHRGRAAGPIAAAFPGTVIDGVVDRAKLGAAVLGKPDALRQLEAIIHPLVREEEEAFVAGCRKEGAGLAVIDVPLLLETGGESRCDAVLVVTAPAEVQRERVLARQGMTAEKLAAILSRQMPDAEKRRHAHFLVDTSRGLMAADRQVGSILTALAGRPGRVAAAKLQAES
ncbi:MAG: dephospho-CoA kinase [Bosea sp.]|uniref:dephospho-CoA kinase n=1 Tax=unclassified Bosea (in: a-proteobacteria) TaxID=2653178 RepID=UPI000960FE9B|nr:MULTISPECIES: dephospho-CoA kinase [unclassified Bosea (in: a-proteobacteria)]MBN9441949.1 dephospho-CoA kinase [Bosea sp. (in: a-proteobacteria)]MBN9449535.1 dephospho-CoA kinase [Bosea sp. (in: a-proteobacteria)]MBN9459562.1 dephospho-CoA kinase [Bosea sp. (in: a-proteobacteria)]OJV11797.1 MAG: dephospho-CoA kinase [Bosea sp. 67-29]